MPWFIKTEKFNSRINNLTAEKRRQYLQDHRSWIMSLRKLGTKVSSGYLVNEHRLPGGGGLLFLQAKSYNDAQHLIKKDPMIMADLVTWELQEWIPVEGELMNILNVDAFP